MSRLADAPGGRTAFVRLASANDLQGTAAAVVAARAGLRRVLVIEGPHRYGAAVAGGFERAAEAAGVEIAGSIRWPSPGDAGAVGAVVHATDADGVLLAGRLADGGAQLLRALRAQLGPEVRILLPDGFTPVPDHIVAIGRRSPCSARRSAASAMTICIDMSSRPPNAPADGRVDHPHLRRAAGRGRGRSAPGPRASTARRPRP